MLDKPVLFVDIDSEISSWGSDSDARPPGASHDVDGIIHFLSFEAAEHLLALGERLELVCGGGWEEKAEEHLAYATRVPAGPPFLSLNRNPRRGHGHLERAAIEAHAGPSRPLAGIDDAHDDACRAWAGQGGAPTLLVATIASSGLTAAGAETPRAWDDGPGAR